MPVALSSLRVSADMDASGYARGATAVASANAALAASGAAVAAGLAKQDVAAQAAGGTLGRLSRTYVDGYGNAARFWKEVQALQTQMELGRATAERAGPIYQGIAAKFGMVASAVEIAKNGNADFAAVVDVVNAKIGSNVTALNKVIEANQRLGAAENAAASQRMVTGMAAATDQSLRLVAGLTASGVAAREAQQSIDALAASEARLAAQAKAARDAVSASMISGMSSVGANPASVRMVTGMSASGADARASQEQAAALQTLQARYVPLIAAQQQYRAQLDDINALTRAGLLTEAQRAEAIMTTKANFVQQVNTLRGVRDSTDQSTAATQRGTAAMGLARFEVINLSRQIQDVGVSLAGGQSPFMVLIQQGAQIGDIFSSTQGTVGGFFRQTASWLGGFLTAGRLAFGGVAATIGLGVSALTSYGSAQREVARSLTGIGRASGLTAGGINDIAQQGASPLGQSVSEAREFASTLAATGRVGRDEIGSLVKLGHDFAVSMGVDGKDAAQALAKAMADPVRGADELNQRLGFMDAAQQRQIKNLVEQNKVAEAQRVIIAGIQSSITAANEQTGFWSKTWTAIGNAISNSYDGLGRILSRATGIGATLEDQLETAQTAAEHYRKLASGQSVFDSSFTQIIDPSAAEKLKVAEAEVDRLKGKIGDMAKASKDAKASLDSLRQSSTVENLLPEIGDRNRLQNQLIAVESIFDEIMKNGGPASEAMLRYAFTWAQLLEAIKKAKAEAIDYATANERATAQAAIQLRSVTAFTPIDRAKIAADQAREANRGNPEADKRAQEAYTLSIKQTITALSEAQRARELQGTQARQSSQLELDLVGKSIGDQVRLTAVLQARQQLEQEANAQHRLVNGALSADDEAKLDRLRKEINLNAGLKQAIAERNAASQATFDLQTVYLSDTDRQIAAVQRSLHGDAWQSFMNDGLSATLRLTASLKSLNDMAGTFASGFFKDISNGVAPMQALANAAKQLDQTLIDVASKSLVSSALGSVTGGLTGSASGAAGMTAGATTAASVLTTAGTSVAAAFVAGATEAASILGIAAPAAGAALAAGGATAGAQTGVGGVAAAASLIAGGATAGTETGAGGVAAAAALLTAAPAIGLAIQGPIIAALVLAAAVVASILGSGESSADRLAQQQANQRGQQLLGTLSGTSGSLQGQAADMQSQTQRAVLDLAGRNQALAWDLINSTNAAVLRMQHEFLEGWAGTIDALNAGLGDDSPFSRARANVDQLAKSISDFVNNTQFVTGNAAMVQQAQAAGQNFLLGLIAAPKDLSDVQQELGRIHGTASALTDALVKLGASSDQAATAINGGVTAAVAALGTKFTTSLTARLNAANGQGFLNDLATLVTQHQQDLTDAASLGLSQNLANSVFFAEAQKIVDDANLTGDAFAALGSQFPDLIGNVHAATSAIEDQAAAQQKLNDVARSIVDYVNGLSAGQQSTLSPQDRLAAAQGTYNAQLALAASGNLDAQSSITKYAEDFRTAARDMFGSATAYQSIENQIKSQLSALPAVTGTNDPVVLALRDVQAAVVTNNNLVTAANALETAQNGLVTTQNTLTVSANAILGTQQTLLNSINSLQGTAADQLRLLTGQLTGGSVTLVTSGTVIGSTNSASIDNNMITALNKVVINTARIATNTAHYPDNYPVHGDGIGVLARGGWVRGPGSATSDSIYAGNAFVSNGEYVVNAAAARALGPLMDGFVNRGQLPFVGVPAAANDNGDARAVIAELRALRAEVAALRRDQGAGLSYVADAVRDGADSIAGATDDAAKKSAETSRLGHKRSAISARAA